MPVSGLFKEMKGEKKIMECVTISFQQEANAAKPEHNRRTTYMKKVLKNIDPDLTCNNIIFCDTSLQQAYHDAFDASVLEYNRKQKRKDRQIKDYYTDVKNDAKRNLMYEAVIQFGDHESVGIRTEYNEEEKSYLEWKDKDILDPEYVTEMEKKIQKVQNAQKAEKALKKFVETWEERNPHFYLYAAYYHADEKDGTLHVHLDFIPCASGYERGMNIQNGLDRACQQDIALRMTPDEIAQEQKRRWKHAENRWQDLQRQDLQGFAQEFGLQASWDREQNEQRRHMKTQEYRKYAEEIESLKKENQALQQENREILAEFKKKYEKLERQIQRREKDLEEKNRQLAEAENSRLESEEIVSMIREERDMLVSKCGHLKKMLEDLKVQGQVLEDQIAGVEQEKTAKNQELREIEQKIAESEEDLEEISEKVVSKQSELEVIRKEIADAKVEAGSHEVYNIFHQFEQDVARIAKSYRENELPDWIERRKIPEKRNWKGKLEREASAEYVIPADKIGVISDLIRGDREDAMIRFDTSHGMWHAPQYTLIKKIAEEGQAVYQKIRSLVSRMESMIDRTDFEELKKEFQKVVRQKEHYQKQCLELQINEQAQADRVRDVEMENVALKEYMETVKFEDGSSVLDAYLEDLSEDRQNQHDYEEFDLS